MKRVFLVAVCACLILSLCACGKSSPPTVLTPPPEESDAFSAPPTVLTPPEYVLYTNIFYNNTGDDYVGQTFTKTGTLARIEDAFNGRTRWYVWGYNDQTKCCDWQWEIVPKDEAALPEIGSLVEATGTFTASESALDGYWITDAEVSVQTPAASYTPYAIQISAGRERLTISDVLVGEVWFASGQSNMEMPIRGFGGCLEDVVLRADARQGGQQDGGQGQQSLHGWYFRD